MELSGKPEKPAVNIHNIAAIGEATMLYQMAIGERKADPKTAEEHLKKILSYLRTGECAINEQTAEIVKKLLAEFS